MVSKRTRFPDAKPNSLVLYGHPASGHSYKVALFLALARIDCRYRPVDIFAPIEKREPSFRKASRFGEVPVLVADGRSICQSNAILLWLAERYGCFAGRTPGETFAVNEWLFWEMSRLSLGVANLRYLLKYDLDSAPDLLDHYRIRSLSALEQLDHALTGRDFLVGDAPTVADISCCGYLYWLDEARIAIDAYPSTKRWLNEIAGLPHWQPPERLLAHTTADRADQ